VRTLQAMRLRGACAGPAGGGLVAGSRRGL